VSEVQVTPWPGKNTPSRDDLLAKFTEEGITPYTWGNPPGDRYAPHTHPYHKVIYVVKGSVTFDLPEAERKVEIKAGDRLDLPSGILHEALVGPDGVECLEGRRWG
jgi:quercetin dioxygenase-like cupin family protein